MEYDIKMISALQDSIWWKAFDKKAKRSLYELSQDLDPELKGILLTALNSNNQEDLDQAKIAIVKYYENFKEESEAKINKGIKKAYVLAENESSKNDNNALHIMDDKLSKIA